MTTTKSLRRGAPFSEKNFYLEEFRGRTLGIFLPPDVSVDVPVLSAVIDELRDNQSRTVIVAATSVLSTLGCQVLHPDQARLEGLVWRRIQQDGRVGISAGPEAFETMLSVAQRLELFKVMRLADLHGLHDEAGGMRSFIDGPGLRDLLRTEHTPHVAVLRQVDRLLEAGIQNVNVCTVAGLHDELFTYAGSGTLFTRERYILVRRLGIDDYDAAHDLITRGVAEGYLAPRSDEALDEFLVEGFGVFVAGQHLAGIGALRAFPNGCGEVSSLYTLTRFLGAGLGSDLVAFALDRARQADMRSVFACTTSERVGAFFERLGFTASSPDALPAGKWVAYDANRRRRVRCYTYVL